jgi:chromosome segregation ATPase
MLTLDRPQDAKLKERGAARNVRVRVGPNGPVVDLPTGKTTIGASPRCNIRIQQPGVQPLHCLILNEASGLSVRRWAGETVLNGRPVEEAAIDRGDCLRVGPVELEIVGPESTPPITAQNVSALAPSPTAPPTPASPIPAPSAVGRSAPVMPAPSPATPASPIAAPGQQVDARQERVGREIARSRSRQLLTALRERTESSLVLQRRVTDMERELQRAASDRSDFAGQLQSLSSQLAEARRQASVRQESTAAYEDLASQNEQLGREVCAMIQRIEQLTNEAAASSAALHAALVEKESFAAECGSLSDERSRLHEQLQQQIELGAELTRNRDEARVQCESLRAELRAVAEREIAAAGRAEHLDRELSAIRQREADLANQNNALCGERDEAWRQCDSLRSNVHALSERESSLVQHVERLEQENSQQQSHRDELLTQLSAAHSERDEAWRQSEALRREVQALTEREVALSESVRRLEQVDDQHQSRETELSNQVAAACGERNEAWRECESLRSEIQSLKDREVSLSENINRLQDTNDQLQSRETELTEQIATLCRERDEAWRQGECLRSEVQSLKDREISLSESVSRLEHATGEQQSREAELSNQIAAVSGERDAAWRQCESLRAEVNSFREQQAALTENASRLEHESHELQARADELTDQIVGLRSERDEARLECDALRSEVRSSNEREAALAENIRRLEDLEADRVREHHELTGQVGALRAEYDDLRDQNEQLRSQVTNLVHERAALTEDHAAGNRELDSLRAQLQAAVDKDVQHCEELAKLTAECQQYRDESDRLPQLEQQIRDAVADRENTSSELYRALLQLAEIQERDDHNVALEAAYRAVNAELEKSTRDIAALQVQIDSLIEERIATDEARQSLDRRTAELIEAHQQLAYDKSTLNAELNELREQLDSARQREVELAADLESAAALRQQLAETEKMLAERDEMVARIQNELQAKAALEAAAADAAAAMDQRDQQIAEYAQLLAESGEAVRRLEQKCAAAIEAAAEVEQARDDGRREREEAARNQARLLERISQLESNLADAEAATQHVAQSMAATHTLAEYEQARDEWRQQCEQAAQLHSRLSLRIDELESQLADAQAAAQCAPRSTDDEGAMPLSSGWNDDYEADFDRAAARPDESDTANDFGTVLGAQGVEPPAEYNWSSPNADASSESDQDPFAESARSLASGSVWGGSPSDSPVSEAIEGDTGSDAAEAWPSSGPRGTEAGWTCTKAVDWAASDSSNDLCDPSPSKVEELDGKPGVETTVPSHKSEPTSFIERYSHLFANDSAVEAQPAPPASAAPARETRMQSSAPIVRPAAVASLGGDGEEESIEEYMAKLLQRVRGDSPGQTTPPAEANHASERVSPMTAPASFTSFPLTAPPSAAGADHVSPIGFDPSKRRSSTLAPQTDLEALRALANESARRAISRHALRKHRRTAMTKVIVSSLAGVTSLWLMLESESWFNLQFITACVSMCVAAYWASETIRMLVESLRVAETDETDAEIEQLSAKLRSPLPIDVESGRTWTTQPLNSSDEKPEATASVPNDKPVPSSAASDSVDDACQTT